MISLVFVEDFLKHHGAQCHSSSSPRCHCITLFSSCLIDFWRILRWKGSFSKPPFSCFLSLLQILLHFFLVHPSFCFLATFLPALSLHSPLATLSFLPPPAPLCQLQPPPTPSNPLLLLSSFIFFRALSYFFPLQFLTAMFMKDLKTRSKSILQVPQEGLKRMQVPKSRVIQISPVQRPPNHSGTQTYQLPFWPLLVLTLAHRATKNARFLECGGSLEARQCASVDQ